jgi:hypothetical protein
LPIETKIRYLRTSLLRIASTTGTFAITSLEAIDDRTLLVRCLLPDQRLSAGENPIQSRLLIQNIHIFESEIRFEEGDPPTLGVLPLNMIQQTTFLMSLRSSTRL